MTINDLATERWAKDEPNPKIGFWCVLFISESNSANIFANGCNELVSKRTQDFKQVKAYNKPVKVNK